MVKASSARKSDSIRPTTVDADEVARFNALAAEWWDPNGPMRPLHAMTPARMQFLRDALCAHFGRDSHDRSPLKGLEILDIGCGAGLASEPLARLGARVTGLDAAADAIAAARVHASLAGLSIDYRVGGPEALASDDQRYDCVIALEVLEHVSDVPTFLEQCRHRLKPNGLLAFSTLNRSAAAFLSAIVGAEYLLRLLPRGTHDWRKFLRPKDLQEALEAAGFVLGDIKGLGPDPLRGGWQLTQRTPVNYIGWATLSAM
jgi:2-polyprenyl-6-hydroxyphenyl methylase / 3-demethylubiquinone-9 3-methyltransferase